MEAYRDELVINPTKNTFYYGFNLRAGPLADAPKLREALSMALSREIVVERVTRFGEPAAYSFVPPVFGAYDPPELPWVRWSAQRREAEAEATLAAESDDRRDPGELRVLYNTNEGLRRITVAITSMWRESLGVEAVPENQEFGVWLQTLGDASAWDVTRLSWRPDFDDPFGFLEIFMSDSPNNFVGFADPEYDRLIARSHVAPDPDQRLALLRQAEQRLLDAHAIAPVYFYVDRILVKPWVEVGRRAVIEPLPTKDVRIVPDRR
jgi:oligopeptide transport system substrate-binding protein